MSIDVHLVTLRALPDGFPGSPPAGCADDDDDGWPFWAPVDAQIRSLADATRRDPWLAAIAAAQGGGSHVVHLECASTFSEFAAEYGEILQAAAGGTCVFGGATRRGPLPPRPEYATAGAVRAGLLTATLGLLGFEEYAPLFETAGEGREGRWTIGFGRDMPRPDLPGAVAGLSMEWVPLDDEWMRRHSLQMAPLLFEGFEDAEFSVWPALYRAWVASFAAHVLELQATSGEGIAAGKVLSDRFARRHGAFVIGPDGHLQRGA